MPLPLLLEFFTGSLGFSPSSHVFSGLEHFCASAEGLPTVPDGCPSDGSNLAFLAGGLTFIIIPSGCPGGFFFPTAFFSWTSETGGISLISCMALDCASTAAWNILSSWASSSAICRSYSFFDVSNLSRNSVSSSSKALGGLCLNRSLNSASRLSLFSFRIS
uniref:Uncharacterized protein n=1 Tax=Opuntia streptacantha TaxID=393608 RepID=A0A7C9CMP3_OPUST